MSDFKWEPWYWKWAHGGKDSYVFGIGSSLGSHPCLDNTKEGAAAAIVADNPICCLNLAFSREVEVRKLQPILC